MRVGLDGWHLLGCGFYRIAQNHRKRTENPVRCILKAVTDEFGA